MYPTEAEIVGDSQVNTQHFHFNYFVLSSPPAGPTASYFSYTYVFFFNLGNWKMFDYGGAFWLSPGVLVVRLANVRCSFSALCYL